MADLDKISQAVQRIDMSMHGTNGTPGLVHRVANIEEAYKRAEPAITWGMGMFNLVQGAKKKVFYSAITVGTGIAVYALWDKFNAIF